MWCETPRPSASSETLVHLRPPRSTVPGRHYFRFFVSAAGAAPITLVASNYPTENDGSGGAHNVADVTRDGERLQCTTYAVAWRTSTTVSQFSCKMDESSNYSACTTIAMYATALLMEGVALSAAADVARAVEEGCIWHMLARRGYSRATGRAHRVHDFFSVFDLYEHVGPFKSRLVHHRVPYPDGALEAPAAEDGAGAGGEAQGDAGAGDAAEANDPTRQGDIQDDFRHLWDILAWGAGTLGATFGAVAAGGASAPAPGAPGAGYSILLTCRGETLGMFVPWRGPACLVDSHGHAFGDGQPDGAYVAWFVSPSQMQDFLRQRFRREHDLRRLNEAAYEMNVFTLARDPRDGGSFR